MGTVRHQPANHRKLPGKIMAKIPKSNGRHEHKYQRKFNELQVT